MYFAFLYLAGGVVGAMRMYLYAIIHLKIRVLDIAEMLMRYFTTLTQGVLEVLDWFCHNRTMV